MANDVAPVCNLPNIGQVPALQPGRMFPAVPKAQDLPSVLQAINTLTQIVIQLTSPGLPPFKNNLAPYNAGSHTTGTPGILGAAGSDGSAGQKGKDGKKGKEAQNPQWHETNRKTENVKVKGLHDNEDAYLIMRRVNSLTITSNVDGKKTIVWQGNPSFVATGGVVLEEGQELTTGGASNALPHVGTNTSSRETIEQNDSFPANSKSAQGTKDRPFQPGLMSDCVGVKWGVKGCRFAVCGYDGHFIGSGFGDIPVFFGVGAYSEDGKNWTTFRNDVTGVSIFPMRNPRDKKSNIVVMGGSTNQELGGAFANSTAKVVTIVGSGVSGSGATADGRNTAAYVGLGYDKEKGIFYAVSVRDNSASPVVSTFNIGDPKPSSSSRSSKKPSIYWVGTQAPGIGPVINCTATATNFAISGHLVLDPVMTIKDTKGVEHVIDINDDGHLLYDGADVTPPGADPITSAAIGVNDAGEIIIIGTGFKLNGDEEDQGAAWWSIEGKGWSEISGVWTGESVLQASGMASAVPNF